MDKIIKKKRGLCDQPLFKSQNNFRKNFLLVVYYLTKLDDVIDSSFSVNSKITSANLCKSTHDITNYSDFICPLFHCMFVGIPFILI